MTLLHIKNETADIVNELPDSTFELIEKKSKEAIKS